MSMTHIPEDEAPFIEMIKCAFDEIMNVSELARNVDNFVLSAPIVRDVVTEFARHRDLIEESHSRMKGTEACKVAGYLCFWIATLKPIQILEVDPDEHEILINEYLAITVAALRIHQHAGVYPLTTKIVNDLKYALRYRVLTLRMLPMILESYISGFVDGREEAGK